MNRVQPYNEYLMVRTRVPKADDKGRAVAVGSRGAIVHVYQTKPDETPAYIVEVVIIDENGMQRDALVFDVLHDEVEPADPRRGQWWLETSGGDFHWARLQVSHDGKAEVIDLDGKTHLFATVEEAKMWLLEDEYETLESLRAAGEVDDSVKPPSSKDWPEGVA